jgi:hypothetical protein
MGRAKRKVRRLPIGTEVPCADSAADGFHNSGQRQISRGIWRQRGRRVFPLYHSVTDSGREIVASADKPAITNLLTIYAALNGTDRVALTDAFRGESYEQFKSKLAEALIETLRPIQERYQRWLNVPDELIQHLVAGAERAASIASGTMRAVREHLGFLQGRAPVKS